MNGFKIEYVIVQAGGKGTRLGSFVRNKPKCMVPFENLPILFHLFRRFPGKRFIIIGDYKYETLERYLEAFAKVQYLAVRAEGSGTCAGLRQALRYVPEESPFMIIWSDLIIGQDVDIDGLPKADYIGIAEDFLCRWSYGGGKFVETPSKEQGVAGMFLFQDKKSLSDLPESGELVRFFFDKQYAFMPLRLGATREIGTAGALKCESKNEGFRCRPFNKIEITGEAITKIPVDNQGKILAVRELAWYKEVKKYNFKQIPDIVSYDPFTMRLINGQNIFRMELDDMGKKTVIDKIVAALTGLHSLKTAMVDCFSIKEAYYIKTVGRLNAVRNLIPLADKTEIVVNGKKCKNIYFQYDRFRVLVEKMLYETEFAFIHGDCTFSNIMIDDDLNITFLDPRGYFGFTELYGDTAYDWAKVFYSIAGNYDQFNNKNFTLDVENDAVTLKLGTNGWEHLTDYYLSKVPISDRKKIRFIHAIIWLSLTAYAWEDYDSVCGAFYNGIFLMDEFLKDQEDQDDRLF
jgi:aminoglycoside phosphotransferase